MFSRSLIVSGGIVLAGSALGAAAAAPDASGRVPHAMLLEILTDQAYGTMIRSH